MSIQSSHLFSAVRVLRAWDDVCRAGIVLHEAARRHGFGTARTLCSQWKAVTGEDVATHVGSPVTDLLLDALVKRMTILT